MYQLNIITLMKTFEKSDSKTLSVGNILLKLIKFYQLNQM